MRVCADEGWWTTLAAVLVVLATEHTHAIHWLGLSAAGAAQCRQARLSLGLTGQQVRLCRAAPEALVQVARAAAAATSTCQHLLQDRRWNCSSVNLAPHFTPDLTSGTREQAFVYALSSAAVTHALARACAAGLLPQCSCAAPPQEPADGQFQWGGCGDNLQWAVQFARQFVDSGERRRRGRHGGRRYQKRMRLGEQQQRDHHTLAAVNLHNNRVGRRAVEASVRPQCKCHGVSGSCSLRTCWRALPPRLAEVGAQLLRRLPKAVLYTRHPHPAPDQLLFTAPSPDYCSRDFRVGSVGTVGRLCNASGSGGGGCGSMCCGRGYVTQRVERVERCHCKYYWCCYVKCKTCRYWEDIHLCI